MALLTGNTWLGKLFVLAVIAFFAYGFYVVLTSEEEVRVSVVSKSIGISRDDPSLQVQVAFPDTNGSDTIFIKSKLFRSRSGERSLWNSLEPGKNYTLKCVNFLGTWNCYEIAP